MATFLEAILTNRPYFGQNSCYRFDSQLSRTHSIYNFIKFYGCPIYFFIYILLLRMIRFQV